MNLLLVICFINTELRMREQDKERQKREWELKERQAEEQRRNDEELMRRQAEEMQIRMHRQVEILFLYIAYLFKSLL